LCGKLRAVLDEFDEVLGGGAGIGTMLKNVQRQFDEAWCARYAHGQTNRYVWRHAQDVPQIKRLLKALGYDELCDRALRYIESEDPFLLRARHPFGLFVSGINSYAGAGTSPDLTLEGEPPPDCRHTPRCRTDQEHTKKRATDLRA
jgi:hypothetical protein